MPRRPPSTEASPIPTAHATISHCGSPANAWIATEMAPAATAMRPLRAARWSAASVQGATPAPARYMSTPPIESTYPERPNPIPATADAAGVAPSSRASTQVPSAARSVCPTMRASRPAPPGRKAATSDNGWRTPCIIWANNGTPKPSNAFHSGRRKPASASTTSVRTGPKSRVESRQARVRPVARTAIKGTATTTDTAVLHAQPGSLSTVRFTFEGPGPNSSR
jgi:hypothetical protein